MRIGNVAGRLALIDNDRVIDVAQASDGVFGPEVHDAYAQWDNFIAWARNVDLTAATTTPLDATQLGNPVPYPEQIFAIGLNYVDHAAESQIAVSDSPAVFTKFHGSLAGPYGDITLPDGNVDWEVELVAVIGRRAEHVAAADGWDYIAGLAVGQDLSERIRQFDGPVPQFSLGKSFPGFGPIGPYLVTPDEFDNPDDLELGCLVNGEQMQQGRTTDMVFSVPQLVAELSAVVPLNPGDVLFTGTPAGVGFGRKPQQFLAPGDVLETYVEGIGTMQHQFVAASDAR